MKASVVEAAANEARYCGRNFSETDLKIIQEIIADSKHHPTRAAISRAVCEKLAWLRPDGRLKDMSARVALLRMADDGLITLPAPTRAYNPFKEVGHTTASDPGETISGSRGDLAELNLRLVTGNGDSRLWRELIQRYHYLGYNPLPGAQARYLILDGQKLLGAIGFGAAAWKVAPRDHYIGWTVGQREKNLHLVVNNARFLILPWVKVRYLASSILALAARAVHRDWPERYGYRPVLLESFVEADRFTGTSYRAANWLSVGLTQGRGKLDRYHRQEQPLKEIYLYPLSRDFRRQLKVDE